MKKQFVWTVCLLLAGPTVLAQSLTDDQIRQQALSQPPSSIIEMSQWMGKNGVPDPIRIDFIKGDFDGSGLFRDVVAFYRTNTVPTGFLRMFEQRNGTLVPIGEQEGTDDVGGYGFSMELVDVTGTGIPALEVNSQSANGQDEYFSLFMWTGSSLHNMLQSSSHPDEAVENARLADIDDDGIMELILSNTDGQGFPVYKLVGNTYQSYQTFPQDPTGFLGSNGVRYVRSACHTLNPDSFALADVQQALVGKPANGTVHFLFGGLQSLSGAAVDIGQVDQGTIKVGPTLSPLHVSMQPNGTGSPPPANKAGCQNASPARIDVEVSRADLLKSLHRLKLTAPLAVGDQLDLRLRGKLMDGTLFTAVTQIRITGAQDAPKAASAK